MISVAFVGLAANSKAADVFINNQTRIHLDSNNYPGSGSLFPTNWYYPGDTITGWLEGRPTGGVPVPPADGLEDTLDVVAWADDPLTMGCDAGTLAQAVLQANNIAIDQTTGRGVFSFSGTSTVFMSDGPYCAYVAPGDYIEGTSPSPYLNRNTAFEIHEYYISATTDRGGYIPGNTVSVYYFALRIKDGSPMTMTGYQSNWLAQSSDGLTYAYGTLTQSTGQFNFTISNNGGVTPPESYPVNIWFNSTGGGATRKDSYTLNVRVGNLACSIDAPSSGSTYAPGAVMEIEVAIEAAIPFSGSYNYPGAGVLIKILNGTTITSPELTAYTKTFTSDGVGMVRYAFVLDATAFFDGYTYTISANATSILKYASDSVTFNVRKSLVTMSVRLTLNQDSYYSGETAAMSVAAQPPLGHSQPSTYFYKVYDSSGAIYAVASISTSTYSFHIPSNFEGTLYFAVDVYNVDGDYGSDYVTAGVDFGVMIVNVNPFEYNANDVLTANFELKSTVMTGATTVFYYDVWDGSRDVKTGTINTGGSLSGSVQYTVPNFPAQSYKFTIYASGAGRVISESATVYIVSDFLVTISFDKTGYNTGDTMKVHYKLSARSSGTPLPRIFTLTYGLEGCPSVSIMTTNTEGDVNYVVPSGANEGQTLFGLSASWGMTSASAVEVVTIGPAPSEISLFDAFLLVLIVILFLLVLAMRGRGAGAGAGAPKPKEEKAAPPPPPGQQTSPMIVNCKACGAPIEITTSKRPIEVMCPSCGETAMVQ